MTNLNRRPFAQVRHWTWKGHDGSTTPGIGITRGNNSVIAHLSWVEARRFADRIHDLADANGDQEPTLPTTEAERE